MSAAGTFATCLALADLLGLDNPREIALEATHIAEAHHRTGLGDAVAQSIGGYVLRKRAGVPPHGVVSRLDYGSEDMVLCVLGAPIKTSETLADPIARQRIIGVGSECMAVFQSDSSYDNFFGLAYKFADKTGLASPATMGVLDELWECGKAGMAMLGNSVFVSGDMDAVSGILASHGEIIKTKIDKEGGARLLD